MIEKLRTALACPLDASLLAYFRICLGLLLAWHAGSYLYWGRVERYFVAPEFHFSYPLFGWVEPLPGQGMVVLFCAMLLLGLLVAVGAFYRVSASLLFLAHTYVFLIDKARYQNHLYLVCLLTFLAIWIPAHRCWSVDAWRRRELHSNTVPAWTVWLLRFQVGVPYLFGGLAKINADWLRGEPLREWLPRKADIPWSDHGCGTRR